MTTFQPQVCERCERDRIDDARTCYCGAKWTEMLNAPPVSIVRTADDAERAARGGWRCPDCGHLHTGQMFGFICIGCVCARRTPQMATAGQE